MLSFIFNYTLAPPPLPTPEILLSLYELNFNFVYISGGRASIPGLNQNTFQGQIRNLKINSVNVNKKELGQNVYTQRENV